MNRCVIRTSGSCAIAVLVALALTAPAFAAAPMNVVLLVADDLGWADTSLLSHKNLAPTPHLDRLAARGMIFSRAYAASPVCTPTRASIQTGLHPVRLGMFEATGHAKGVVLDAYSRSTGPTASKTTTISSATRLRFDTVTLAESLKSAGYATGHFGKWHLGRAPYTPQAHGFDVDAPGTYAAGPPGGYIGWKTETMSPSPASEHIEARTTTEAIRFIRANRYRPFFLQYGLFSVHAPFEAKPDLLKKYRDLAEQTGSSQSPTYAAMVEMMDNSIGRLIDQLDALNLSQNTIVIFVSDNGGNVHERIDGLPPANNGPLRGGKSTLWEGGTRVPCAIVWPGVVPPGSFSTANIQTIDFYPTILAMLGLLPQSRQKFDGVSIVPALRGRPLTRDALFMCLPRKWSDGSPAGIAVIVGDLKLYRFFYDGPYQTHRYEFYDLSTDIRERRNLAAQFPDVVDWLDDKIDDFLLRTHAVVPEPNPSYRAK